MPEWIIPEWPAAAPIRSVITTRRGGMGQPPFDDLNLASHVGDAPQTVAYNRAWLREELDLPSEPLWLHQVHGCAVVEAGVDLSGCCADVVMATGPGQVCAVLTADCLPLLICNRSGTRVAAVHAGWRGLAAGVIEAALDHFDDEPGELLVWLGPAIGPAAFEVGGEVRDLFVASNSTDAEAFTLTRPGYWLTDIYRLARTRLLGRGVGFVGGGNYCTVSEPERFFSYRRDGLTGRMASLIWIE